MNGHISKAVRPGHRLYAMIAASCHRKGDDSPAKGVNAFLCEVVGFPFARKNEVWGKELRKGQRLAVPFVLMQRCPYEGSGSSCRSG